MPCATIIHSRKPQVAAPSGRRLSTVRPRPRSVRSRINLAVLVGVGTTANETYDYDFLAPLQHPP
jgi:hypothetical protein